MSDDASNTGTAPAQGTENSSVANSRPKRERKTVDTLKYAVKEVIEIPLDVPEGKGTPLGDIENVRQRLDKTKANSPSNILKKLHAVLFGKQKCTVKNVKAHIREFKGIPEDQQENFKSQGKPLLEKMTLDMLKDAKLLFDVEFSGTKAAIIEAILDFLCEPSSSGRAFKFKIKGARATSSKGKGKKRKASKKKEKGVHKQTGYQLFCAEQRLKLKKSDPDMPQKDVMSKLGEIWRGFSDEDKQTYKDRAGSSSTSGGSKPAKRAKKTKEVEDSDDSEDTSDDEPLVQVDHTSALQQDIKKILADADLSTMSVKIVRKTLEKKFGAKVVARYKSDIKEWTKAEASKLAEQDESTTGSKQDAEQGAE